MEQAAFSLGVNLPWLRYGCDFGSNAWQPEGGVGSPAGRERLKRSFARLAGKRLTVVRWFMLCDGRAGIRFDAGGDPLGLDDLFIRDLEAGLAEAAAAGISLVPVLVDFPWCGPRRSVNGVQCGGRRRVLASDERLAALLERVIVPIVSTSAGHEAVAAWDIVNEPEWVTWGVRAPNPLRSLSRSAMRRFISRTAAAVRAACPQPLTVGLASAASLDLVRGLGLDFYQVHWYDPRERRAPLAHPYAAALDRPIWLGEFPTAGSRRPPEAIISTARQAGYACALAWSAEATDRHSDLDGSGLGA